jgi:hypothetical protein
MLSDTAKRYTIKYASQHLWPTPATSCDAHYNAKDHDSAVYAIYKQGNQSFVTQNESVLVTAVSSSLVLLENLPKLRGAAMYGKGVRSVCRGNSCLGPPRPRSGPFDPDLARSEFPSSFPTFAFTTQQTRAFLSIRPRSVEHDIDRLEVDDCRIVHLRRADCYLDPSVSNRFREFCCDADLRVADICDANTGLSIRSPVVKALKSFPKLQERCIQDVSVRAIPSVCACKGREIMSHMSKHVLACVAIEKAFLSDLQSEIHDKLSKHVLFAIYFLTTHSSCVCR